jgi:hypothetical protein
MKDGIPQLRKDREANVEEQRHGVFSVKVFFGAGATASVGLCYYATL